MRKITVEKFINQSTYEPVVKFHLEGHSISVEYSPEDARYMTVMLGLDGLAEIRKMVKQEIREQVSDITDEELTQLDTVV